MEASVCGCNTSTNPRPIALFHKPEPPQHYGSTVPFRSLSFKHNPIINLRLSTKGVSGGGSGGGRGLACGCAQSPPVVDLETEVLEAEMSPDREEWMTQLGTLRGKCKEERGVVELLECLEREAIMGEDEGRDPLDYSKRALVFDACSRVFQALKKRTAVRQL